MITLFCLLFKENVVMSPSQGHRQRDQHEHVPPLLLKFKSSTGKDGIGLKLCKINGILEKIRLRRIIFFLQGQGQGLFCEKQQQNTKNTNNSRHRRNKRFSQGDKKKTEVFKSLSPAFQEKKCS